jgi:peptide deformylase
MIDTMRDAGGVGLAANQVGSLQRVIVVQLPEEDEEARIYVNPEIVHREGQREIEEGCLSVPGYKGLINRSLWVKFSALDHTSMTVKLKAEELLSQALEHEVDHLNGILYLDHLESHDKLVKIEPESEQAAEGSQPGPDAVPVAQSTSDTPASVKVK